MGKCKIAPSLMCANFGQLEKEIKILDKAGVDFYHLDIMDGKFVPNFALGVDFVKQVRLMTSRPLDVHLMVENPENTIDLFIEAGANMMSFHLEATKRALPLLKKIKEAGLKAGIVLNPETSLNELTYLINYLDYVVLMTVSPGFAGQSFVPEMYQKITLLKELLNQNNSEIEIQVDGNIGEETLLACKKRGATMFIGGSSSVYTPNRSLTANINHIKQLFK